MVSFGVILLIVKCLVVTAYSSEDYKLELVQTLFRHGDRTPDEQDLFPTAPYNESTYMPYGYGQLTNIGKRRAYEIGKQLRKRYGDFLGDTYKPSYVHAYTTDTDRTKVTLQLVLASLYPPSDSLKWKENLNWIPIPFTYNLKKYDFLSTSTECPEYGELLKEIKKLPEVIEKVSKFDKTYRYIYEKTGQKEYNFYSVAGVYNLYKCHKSLGLPLPDWLNDDLLPEMQEMVDLTYEIATYTPEIKKVSGGPVIKQFLKNMEAQDSDPYPKKIYLYSAHDLNVNHFLKSHGLQYPTVPPFGTAVIYEKLRGLDGGVYIRLLVWTGADGQLVPLKLEDCDEICPLDKYLEIVKPVLPEGTGTECLFSKLNNTILQQYIKY